MKRNIFVCMAMLLVFACNCQVSAHDYYTVIYKDGSHSQRFYTEFVDSIVCSKITVDSVLRSSWCVQEIWTPDSVYRIPLDRIERIELTAVDTEKVAADVSTVMKSVGPLFGQCSSAADAGRMASEILKLDEVEEVWTDDITLYVKVRNWGTISYLFPPEPADETDGDASSSRTRESPITPKDPGEHFHAEGKKVCLINQQYNDERFVRSRDVVADLSGKFRSCGFSVTVENRPTLSFFENAFFDQDIVCLFTHGCYDEKENAHWHCTGETVSYGDDGLPSDDYFYLLNIYPPNMLNVAGLQEKRNGKMVTVYYWMISEHFLAAASGRFRHQGETIVFDVACQAMKGGNSMANVLRNKGAGVSLAYNESNAVGQSAAREFFTNMLNGMSAYNAALSIPAQYRVEESRNANLVYSYRGKKGLNLCFTKTSTLQPEINKHMKYRLRGSVEKILSPEASPCKFGFKVSMNDDMKNSQYFDLKSYSPSNANYAFSSASHKLEFNHDLDGKEFYEGKPLYYQAYIRDYDAYLKKYTDYCYGDVVKVEPVDVGDGALLETKAATDVISYEATLNGVFYVSDELRELYKEYLDHVDIGFLYGTESEQKVSQMHWVKIGKANELKNGTLSVSVTGLMPDQDYHYFITAHSEEEGYTDNDECYFTTQCDCHERCKVVFESENDWENGMGALVGISTAQIGSYVNDGFCKKHYKTFGFYVNGQFVEVERKAGIGGKYDSFRGVYSCKLSNLRRATTYRFIPTCIIDGKYFYGGECSFLTPDVETLRADNESPKVASYNTHYQKARIYARNIHRLGENEEYEFGSLVMNDVKYAYYIGLEWYWVDDETQEGVDIKYGQKKDCQDWPMDFLLDIPDIFDWGAMIEYFFTSDDKYHFASTRQLTLYYRAYLRDSQNNRIYGIQKSLKLPAYEEERY